MTAGKTHTPRFKYNQKLKILDRLNTNVVAKATVGIACLGLFAYIFRLELKNKQIEQAYQDVNELLLLEKKQQETQNESDFK